MATDPNVDRNLLAQEAAKELGWAKGFNPSVNAEFDAWKATAGNAAKLKALTDNKYKAATAPVPLTTVMGNNVNNPLLPAGTEILPQIQTVQGNELMQGAAPLNPTQYAVGTPTTVNPQTIAAQTGATEQIDINGVMYGFDPTTGSYTPVKTTAVTPMQSAQGTVSNLATVQGQLEKLYADTTSGEVPLWAKGAVNKAEGVMAARGLGASSISAKAITSAIQQSALPIAAQDAATYFQMDLTNLSNEQAARLENFRATQQNMLTDVAVENAALQMNAASESQTQQYVTSMVAGLKTQNANFVNSMTQFNVSQANSIAAQNSGNALQADLANAELKTTVQQFNANMANQRQQFNSSMAFAVEQSNVEWRRQVNTQATADINAAMQINAQNRFNLSATATNNLWQAFRDEAYWMYQSSESAADRNFQATMAANAYQYQSNVQDQAKTDGLWQAAGSFASMLLNGMK